MQIDVYNAYICISIYLYNRPSLVILPLAAASPPIGTSVLVRSFDDFTPIKELLMESCMVFQKSFK